MSPHSVTTQCHHSVNRSLTLGAPCSAASRSSCCAICSAENIARKTMTRTRGRSIIHLGGSRSTGMLGIPSFYICTTKITKSECQSQARPKKKGSDGPGCEFTPIFSIDLCTEAMMAGFPRSDGRSIGQCGLDQITATDARGRCIERAQEPRSERDRVCQAGDRAKIYFDRGEL